MGRPRKPLAKALLEGRDTINAGRYAGRHEHPSEPLGPPPAYMKDTKDCKAKQAWALFRQEIPYLMKRDQTLVEVACQLRGIILAGGVLSAPQGTLLTSLMSKMGATPVDATKAGASAPPADAEDNDEPKSPLAPRPKHNGRPRPNLKVVGAE